MSEKNYLVGIDLGTTNIKGIIIDDDGMVIASVARPCVTYKPGPLMAEQNADEWWDDCVSILRELSQKAGEEKVKTIRCISVSSHMISLLPIDSDGNPLRNAIIYQDSRSANEVDRILADVGRERFIRIVRSQPSVAFLPNKILWYRKNEPELFAKTRAILQANGWLNFKLTGVLNQDADSASRTQCFNMSDMTPSAEIAEAVGADLKYLLPSPVSCSEIIGTVTEEAARITGLCAGTPVAAGMSDAMASMYATGMSTLGEAGESCGTTSLVFIGAERSSPADAPVTTRPCYIKGIPYLYDAPIGSTGASLKWYINVLGRDEQLEADRLGINVYSHLSNIASDVPAGSCGVMFFPYLVAGERAPLWNSYAKGMFIGMNMQTERKHLLRSVFEGTAFALRHVITTVRESGGYASSLRVTGGGSRTDIWNRIKASMLHMPVYTLDDNGGDVPLGDCLNAGAAVGVFPNLTASIKKMIRIKERIDPIPEWERVYDRLYPYYVEMYEKLDTTLKRYKETLDEYVTENTHQYY